MNHRIITGDPAGRQGPRCPNCGFPLSQSSRLCFHCKKFVDVNQNRVLLPGEVTDSELDYLTAVVLQTKESYAKSKDGLRYKKGKRMLIVGGILCFTLLLAVVGFILVVLGLYYMSSEKGAPPEMLETDDIEDVIAAYLVPSILHSAFDQVQEYSHGKCISAQAVRGEQLMQEAYNDSSGSDYIKAMFHGLPVEMCDLELKLDQKNNLGIVNAKTVFKGSFLICDLGIVLPEPVSVWEREGKPPMGPGLLTGNPAFDSKFYVESRHPQTARQLLSPQVQQDILQLDLVGNGQTTVKFSEDGRLYVAIASPQDLFELRQIGEPMASVRQRFTWELSRILQLLSIVAAARDREWRQLHS